MATTPTWQQQLAAVTNARTQTSTPVASPIGQSKISPISTPLPTAPKAAPVIGQSKVPATTNNAAKLGVAQPNMSIGGTSTPATNSGGGVSSAFNGAYNALSGALSSGGSKQTAGVSFSDAVNQGTPQTENPYANSAQDSYKGTPGLSTTNYSAGSSTPVSNNASSGGVSSQQRTANQQIITQDKATKEKAAADITAQIAALQAQLTPEKDPNKFDPNSEANDVEISKQMKALQDQLAQTEQDSPEVLAAKQQEDALNAEEANIKSSLTGALAEVKDQPIPLGFITGQSSAIENRANAKLQNISAKRIPLQQQLANAQAKRQSSLDVVKSQLANLQDERKRNTDIYTKNYDTKQSQAKDLQSNRYKTIGDGTQLYDTLTGKIVANNTKNFAPTSTDVKTAITEVGGRKVLVNTQTGETIKDLGPATNAIVNPFQ